MPAFVNLTKMIFQKGYYALIMQPPLFNGVRISCTQWKLIETHVVDSHNARAHMFTPRDSHNELDNLI